MIDSFRRAPSLLPFFCPGISPSTELCKYRSISNSKLESRQKKKEKKKRNSDSDVTQFLLPCGFTRTNARLNDISRFFFFQTVIKVRGVRNRDRTETGSLILIGEKALSSLCSPFFLSLPHSSLFRVHCAEFKLLRLRVTLKTGLPLNHPEIFFTYRLSLLNSLLSIERKESKKKARKGNHVLRSAINLECVRALRSFVR